MPDEGRTPLLARNHRRGRPSELHVELSLRDDVLRLSDLDVLPDHLRALSPAQRLHEMLASSAYTVYDDTGRNVGQRIPFTLAPLGAIGADPGMVPLYGTSACAERRWSVNASLLGTDLIESSDRSFVRLELLKQNTFFSQWRRMAPAGEPFQVASVRPTRNLFREPGSGAAVGGSEFGTEVGVS